MTTQHLPEWLAERACLDEVPDTLRPELRAALESGLAARRAEIERSSAEILATLPAAGVAIEVKRRAALASRARKR